LIETVRQEYEMLAEDGIERNLFLASHEEAYFTSGVGVSSEGRFCPGVCWTFPCKAYLLLLCSMHRLTCWFSWSDILPTFRFNSVKYFFYFTTYFLLPARFIFDTKHCI